MKKTVTWRRKSPAESSPPNKDQLQVDTFTCPDPEPECQRGQELSLFFNFLSVNSEDTNPTFTLCFIWKRLLDFLLETVKTENLNFSKFLISCLLKPDKWTSASCQLDKTLFAPQLGSCRFCSAGSLGSWQQWPVGCSTPRTCRRITTGSSGFQPGRWVSVPPAGLQ